MFQDVVAEKLNTQWFEKNLEEYAPKSWRAWNKSGLTRYTKLMKKPEEGTRRGTQSESTTIVKDYYSLLALRYSRNKIILSLSNTIKMKYCGQCVT